MNTEADVLKKLKVVLEQHPYLFVEFDNDGFRTGMENLHPNIMGNFTGGDMAYIANASAGFACIVESRVAETASINIECLDRGDGEELLARAKIIKDGKKLIRLRVDVYSRNGQQEKLVAIAQITMSPINNPEIEKLII